MIDLITVVYGQELPLIELQASSLDLYVLPQDINSITVIINDTVDVTVNPVWYGKHIDKVNVIHYATLTSDAITVSGWDSQQLFKLLAAANSTTDWSMVLDAKTMFVQQLDLTKFINGDKSYHTLMPVPNCFSNELSFVEEFYNINLNGMFIGPAGVPFMLHTATVKELINHIEQQNNITFSQFFQSYVSNPPRVTEFILYSGFVVYKYGSFDHIYINIDPNYIFYNISDWETAYFDELVRAIQSNLSKILTISVHRRTWASISDTQRTRWLELLVDLKIINNVENTKTKINI